MFKHLSIALLGLSSLTGFGGLVAEVAPPPKVVYAVTQDPLDVVIPCTAKDKDTLDLAIKGIKKNGKAIRRVIVISKDKLTDEAEWFDETRFPFSFYDIAFTLFGNDEEAQKYLHSPGNRVGWIFQQLVKLYAPFVIDDISSNVLILDSDTIFLNPVDFLDAEGNGLYCTGTECHDPYFTHMARLIPWMKRLYPEHSGIVHHMVFQRAVLDDLFQTIRSYHGIEPWQALLKCVDKKDLFCCLSEYEIYFNFIFARTDQMHIHPLKWMNSGHLTLLHKYKKQGYQFVSFHAFMRVSVHGWRGLLEDGLERTDASARSKLIAEGAINEIARDADGPPNPHMEGLHPHDHLLKRQD